VVHQLVPGSRVVDNRHSTEVRAPLTLSVHAHTDARRRRRRRRRMRRRRRRRRSNVGRVLVLNTPPLRRSRRINVGSSACSQ